jgi:UDP-3-O-[3-hydroxymyristoyl] glucosamine N-acyltransferase
MADPRFFTVAGPFTVAQLAARTGAAVAGAAESDRILKDVAPLDTAGPDDVTFLDNAKYLDTFRGTGAGAAFVHPNRADAAPKSLTLLLTPAPYRAFALASQAFYPDPPPVPGIAASAVVDPTARLGSDCAVEPNAVIGARVATGRACLIGANTVIGPGCILGDDVRIGANASLSHCIIGSRVRIYPGARLGQDGFGFAPGGEHPIKMPQLGRVIVGDDVEIGANTTVDRGAGPDTVIGAGTMIDNLVQIGHNVQVGRGCVLVAQLGIAGSARLGDYVMVGGQVGIIGHLTIGSGARIAGQSGVTRDVAPGETMMGSPAVPIRDHHRQVMVLRRLAKGKGD